MFDLCKNNFPKEATIECVENRLPGTIDVTIKAIPCDGIVECRDGRDENCEEDKWILAIAVSVLCLTTISIYLYLVFVRLPLWKDSVLQDFDAGNIDSETVPFDCSYMKGNKLAKLKVLLPNTFPHFISKIFVYSSFRIIHHKSNVLRHWLWKECSPNSKIESQSMHQ